jgi:hypothetical protein
VLLNGSQPAAASFSFTAGSSSALATSACSWATIAFGVPAGASSPYQGVEPKPAIVSPMVGTSGSAETRFPLTTPSTFSLPLLMNAIDDGRLCTDTCTWPPTRSVTAADAPLYGTCSISMPAVLPSISPIRWLSVPLPAEPIEILPGAAFAAAISSLTFFGLKSLLATST